jgi:hypothetical protein
MKRKGFVLLTVIALLALSGMALAQPGEGEETEETDDTVFNFAYDEGFRLLVLNISPTDGLNDCTLQNDENGDVVATYLTEEGSIVVDRLTHSVEGPEEGPEVVFPGRDDNDEVLYSESAECGLSAAEVTGPNGQVNHGMVMKAWNSFLKAWNYEGKGRGCLNRYLAGSNLGKDGQQVKVSDDSSDFTPVVDGDTGVINFSTFAADCEHGKSNNGNGNGHGNSSEAGANRGGRPDSPGKSGEAAGHNK